MRFRERHQDPTGTDLEYAARINGYGVGRRFHRRAFRLALVRLHGRLRLGAAVHVPDGRAGTRQIEVPKYLRPRTDTPKLTVGYGGCFSCIYSVRGAGGYQMFGITPMPIFDPEQKTAYLQRLHGVLPAGRHRQVQADRSAAYEAAVEEVDERDASSRRCAQVTFDLNEFKPTSTATTPAPGGHAQ